MASLVATAAEQEVAIAIDNISLAGTLTTPDNKPLSKLVIMITGSGAQDRDESIMGHKPFKTIADSLLNRGIASLRLDDRGVGGSGGSPNGNTLKVLNNDISAAVHYVDSIYPDCHIGLLGHSQGGSIAIMQGAHNPRVEFIVTMAAPAWSGDSLIMSQTRAIATASMGRWDNEPIQRYIIDIARSKIAAPTARALIYQKITEQIGQASEIAQVRQQLNSQIDIMVSTYYREMLRYDPSADIKAVHIPWLALNGSKDLQVLPSNLKTFKEHNTNVQTHELEDLNHLFQPAVTGLINEYQRSVPTPAPSVITQIADWISNL